MFLVQNNKNLKSEIFEVGPSRLYFDVSHQHLISFYHVRVLQTSLGELGGYLLFFSSLVCSKYMARMCKLHFLHYVHRILVRRTA